jgi:8-amino-7-oxononanoate synthase
VTQWNHWAQGELTGLRGSGRFRQCTTFDGAGPNGLVNGRAAVSFASNDYLGLSTHPRVCAAAREAIERYGTSASAARLVTGTRSVHVELEQALARHHKVERALLFPSGFSANLGLMTTFGAADVTIFSDELNHASIIDGCRLARARVAIYRHLDMDHLQSLLNASAGRKIIVTETVFSMDGDVAPLKDIAALATHHGALLMLDAAHGVLECDSPSHLDGVEVIRAGTLSKTLGSMGGWIGGPAAIIELLVNRARSFIYTTALTPADTAAARAALQICFSGEGAELRARLRRNITQIRRGHPSPIIPIILGAEAAALSATAALSEQGIFVPAIRPPTVAPGTARLRVALSAAHDDAMIERLRTALAVAGIAA